MPPANREIGVSKKAVSIRHREIHQGAKPAMNPGAMTKNTAEPAIASAFLIFSPDSIRFSVP
jgi:hypothetical protein